MKRRAALFAIPATVLGCASQSGVVDGNPIKQGEGAIALQLSTNAPNGFIGLAPYNASPTAGVARELFSVIKENFPLENGNTYFVRHMTAGDYMWNEMIVGNKKAILYSRSKMTVKEGVVTYIGHIRISIYEKRFEMKVLDREDDMRQHLIAQYPKLMGSLSFEKNLASVGLAV